MKNVKQALETFWVVAAVLSSTAHADELGAQARYDRLPGAELSVRLSEDGRPVLGVDVTQKNDEQGAFCRKYRPVAPNAVPTYYCYTAVSSGDDAKATYEGGTSAERGAMFFEGNAPLLGESWTEKEVDNLLCVKTAPVVLTPVANYTCYTSRPPVGGGVSVGN